MTESSTSSVLILASYPDSIVAFRGALIEEFLKRQISVHVASPDLLACEGVLRYLEKRGVVPHEIYMRRAGMGVFQDLRCLVQLVKLARSIRPDLMLSYTVKPVIYGTLAASRAGVPKRVALITGLGFMFVSAKAGFLAILLRRLYRYALSHADLVFFQNPDDLLAASEAKILPRNTPSVVVNGSGIDLDHHSVHPMPSTGPRFLTIARLLGNKGIREYVAAARKIRESKPEISFNVVGWMDDNPDSISREELGSWIEEGVINFLGRLEDVRPAIADSTVYVLPSYREGTPRTVLEAMSMGRPIITTDAPGCRETVIDGENGFLVPVRSVGGLAEAMRKFIDDPSLAETMGKRSREIAEDKYDVRKVNAVMLREMGIT